VPYSARTPAEGLTKDINMIHAQVALAAVDASTDANQELPDSITIHRQACRAEDLSGGDG